MLKLSIFRHAKSSWDDPSLDDFDRPLGPRGLKAAPRMGRFMQERDVCPELVLCSPAKRTRETLALVAEMLGHPRADYPAELYLGEPEALLDAIRRTQAGVSHLMLIGHNPGLQSLALELQGPGNGEGSKTLPSKFPTGGLAVMTFAVERWTEIERGKGRLELFMTPKRLP